MSGAQTRVVVDLLYYTGRRGGTETYIRQVLPRIARLEPGLQFVALTNTAGRASVEEWFPGELRTLPISGHNRPVWALAESFVVAPVVARLKADLVWSPANFGPGSGRVRRLVTVHDVIAFDFANPQASRLTQQITATIIRRAARGAAHVLTDSDDSAASIVRVLGIPLERITPTPLAGGTPRPVGDVARHLGELGVPSDRPYVLSTGNRMPHKNFGGLIRALAEVPASSRPRVVITGSHGPDPLRGLVAELGLADDVRLLGWVTADQLEALYAGAAAYACPSLAEGFGLPVLDAMLRGCPVLANDLPVLREVGGEAARYADAQSPRGFATALAELVGDEAARRELAEAGRARAMTFSWDRTAEQTAEVLRGLAPVGASGLP